MERKELINVVVVQLHDAMILTTRKILPPFGACARSSIVRYGWKRVFNAIIRFESVSDCLKEGLIIPIYKGKGKDRVANAKNQPPDFEQLIPCA